MSKMSVDEAKRELAHLVTGKFIAITATQHAFVNQPPAVDTKPDKAEIYIEGGYWFRGSTISECVAKVNSWVKREVDRASIPG